MPTIQPTVGERVLEDARDLSRALSDLIRVVQFRDRDRACCHDVGVSQCYALGAIVEHGPLAVNDLAAELYLDKSTVSRVADGLEAKGCVVRQRDARDGRVIRLVATPAGQALHAQIQEDLAHEYANLLTDFDPEVRAAMTRLMGRLAVSFAARVDRSGGTCCRVE